MTITMFVLLIEKKTLIDLIIMIFMSIVFHLKEEYRLYLITVEIVAFLAFLLITLLLCMLQQHLCIVAANMAKLFQTRSLESSVGEVDPESETIL